MSYEILKITKADLSFIDDGDVGFDAATDLKMLLGPDTNVVEVKTEKHVRHPRNLKEVGKSLHGRFHL